MKNKITKSISILIFSTITLVGITSCKNNSPSNIGGGDAPYIQEESLSYFLYIDGIEGDSNNQNHSKWIDVISFSHGAYQSVQTGSPDAAGKSVFEPIRFTHKVDKATPLIQSRCMYGNHIGIARFEAVVSIGEKEPIAYCVVLEDFKIVTAKVYTTDEEPSCLVEEVSMLANKIRWIVNYIDDAGEIKGSTEQTFDQSKKV